MKTALVLQGGGARGIFTSGILDSFLENNISFDCIYAVSAGALNAMNFISKQEGRSRSATSLTFKAKEFKSIKNIIRKHSFVDFNYYFNKLNEILPLDQKTYDNSKTEFVAVATSLLTGKPQYFNKKNYLNFNECIKASSSIPLVSKIVHINSDFYLDGGDSDPLPYKKAFLDGFDKVVIITTRPIDYRKETKQDRFMMRLYRLAYKNYPNFLASLENSRNNYNKEFDELNNYSNSKLFILAPSENIVLKHLENDNEKLNYYFNLGKKIFVDNREKLSEFLR